MPLSVPPPSGRLSPRSSLRDVVKTVSGQPEKSPATSCVHSRPLVANWVRSGLPEDLFPPLAEARRNLTPAQDRVLFGTPPGPPALNSDDDKCIEEFFEFAAISAEEALEAAQDAAPGDAVVLAEKALELCTAAYGPLAQETVAAKDLCERLSRIDDRASSTPPEAHPGAQIVPAVSRADEVAPGPKPGFSLPDPSPKASIVSLHDLPNHLLSWDEEIESLIRHLSSAGPDIRAERALRHYTIAKTGPYDERLKSRLWLEDFKKIVGHFSPSEAKQFESVKVRTGKELRNALIAAFAKVIGHGEPKRQILDKLESKAPTRFNVLPIWGPSGNGKTTLANAVAVALVGAENTHSINIGGSKSSIREGHDSVYTGSHPCFWAEVLMRARGRVCAVVVNEPEKGSEEDQNLLANIMSPNEPVNDLYFGFGLDFSKVWMICTLNNLDRLQPHLLDRVLGAGIKTHGLSAFGRREVAKLLSSQHAEANQSSKVQLSAGALNHVLERNHAAVGARKIENDCERLAERSRALLDSNARVKVLTREEATRHTERSWTSERRSLANTRSVTTLGALVTRTEFDDESTIKPWIFQALGRSWSFRIDLETSTSNLTLLNGQPCTLEVKLSNADTKTARWENQAVSFDVGVPLRVPFVGNVADAFPYARTHGLYVDKTEVIIGCSVELQQPGPLFL